MSLGIVNFGMQAEFLPDDVAEEMRQLSIERQDRRTVAAQRRTPDTLHSAESRSPLLGRRYIVTGSPAPAQTVTARVTEFKIREHLRPESNAKKKNDNNKYELFVMYTVKVDRGDGTSSTIFRRYNDFEMLHDQLPQDIKNCAHLPARRFWARISGSRFSNKSLEGRRQALSTYLGTLCDIASDLPIVNVFLSDAWLKVKKPYGTNPMSGRYIVARKRRMTAHARLNRANGGTSSEPQPESSCTGSGPQRNGGTSARGGTSALAAGANSPGRPSECGASAVHPSQLTRRPSESSRCVCVGMLCE